ncbi:hypothetical protein [Ruegeria arenilitoris]|uniref:hypothetical protein n=1 Tax=Ruegeria arenilitoris TaxID=1173585 RepID=UPI00147CCEFC|nr:hypothetical protein [Ruegeria arenilitoris]
MKTERKITPLPNFTIRPAFMPMNGQHQHPLVVTAEGWEAICTIADRPAWRDPKMLQITLSEALAAADALDAAKLACTDEDEAVLRSSYSHAFRWSGGVLVHPVYWSLDALGDGYWTPYIDEAWTPDPDADWLPDDGEITGSEIPF